MFKDIELSADLMKLYKETKGYDTNTTSLDMNVSILSMGNWPSYPTSPCLLPNDLLTLRDTFAKFYVSKHSGRKLTWQHTLDTCVLKAIFKRGSKELSVSLYQTLILLLFNEAKGSLRLEDIRSATQLGMCFSRQLIELTSAHQDHEK
jgi:cullin 4